MIRQWLVVHHFCEQYAIFGEKGPDHKPAAVYWTRQMSTPVDSFVLVFVIFVFRRKLMEDGSSESQELGLSPPEIPVQIAPRVAG